MTNQEAFDGVWNYFVVEKHPKSMEAIFDEQVGVSLETNCYRTSEGQRCSIGCLIPDDKYDSRWEGNTIICLLSMHKDPVLVALFEGVDPLLLDYLQSAHDNQLNDSTFHYEFERSLRQIAEEAKEYALTVPMS